MNVSNKSFKTVPSMKTAEDYSLADIICAPNDLICAGDSVRLKSAKNM